MTHRRLVVVFVFLVIFSFDLARQTDIDFWWHLRTGQLIADSGTIPSIDPFSYTAAGQSWVAHEWLWELMVFHLYEHGGYVLNVIVSGTLVTLAYVMLYRLMRRLGANEIISAFLVLWAAGLALPNLGVRPREFTHLFLALYLNRLLLYQEGKVRHLWSLPAAMVVWVNVHGTFLLGLGALATVTVGEIVDRLRSRGPRPTHLLVVGLVTIGAACVNPAGPSMLLYPLNYYLSNDNPYFRIITEFQSPDFHDPLFLLFAAGIVALMLLGGHGKRSRVGDALLISAFTLQALVSARQVSVCALVLAPYLAMRLSDRYWWAGALSPSRLSGRFIVVNWLLLASLVVAGALYATRPHVAEELQLGWEPKLGGMPIAGARFIETNNLPDPIFNHQPWGGYLIHRWYPSRPVFIDGRIDMYGPDITEQYTNVVTIQPGWADTLDRYGVHTVLMPKQSALSTLLLASSEWIRVFQGEVEDVLVRNTNGVSPENFGSPPHSAGATVTSPPSSAELPNTTR